MTALLASAPILVVLLLMVGRRWPASYAGAVGAGVALVLGVGWFGLGRVTVAHAGPAGAVAGTAAEAVFVSATILWIIVPALAIHHLQMRTGATEALRDALGRLSSDPRIVALLVAWFFALFAEGAAGFGASVALAAPFLVGAGFRPLTAVVVALIGHAVGVSFGAVGTPVIPQVAATGLGPLEISAATGVYHAIVGWVPLVVLVAIVTRATPAAERTVRVWPWVVLAAALFLAPYHLLARYVGPELPTLGGAVAGGLAFVAVLRLRSRREEARTGARPAPRPRRSLVRPSSAPPFERGAAPGVVSVRTDPRPEVAGSVVRAGAPYLALIVLVLVTRLVAPVRDLTLAVTWRWELYGTFTGSIAPLHHPGTLLVAALLVGAVVQGVGRADLGPAGAATLRQLGAVTVALLAMLLLARTLVHAGMTDALAVAAAAGAGGLWPLAAPFVGLLGTFVTGSATASNVLLTDLQVAAAESLDLPVLPLLGAQGFGAAVGNIVCPHNIVAAGATVGLTGQEGEVLRRTLGVALGYALLGGLLALAFVAAG